MASAASNSCIASTSSLPAGLQPGQQSAATLRGQARGERLPGTGVGLMRLKWNATTARTTATMHTSASPAEINLNRRPARSDSSRRSRSAEPLAIEFGRMLRGGLTSSRSLLFFCAASVAVFAYGAGEHVVRQFDALCAVAILEP